LPGRAERVVRGVLETVQDNEIAVRETEGPIAVPLAAIKAARLDPDPWAGPPAGATQAVAPQAVAPRAKGAGSKSQGRDPKP
jgi:hypothetical protein